MKGWVVYTGILAGLLSSCYLYALKFARPGREDMLISSLDGARKYLPAGSRIKLVNLVPAVNSITVDLFPSFISFVLAPVRISSAPMLPGDTMLVLLPSDAQSSVPDSILHPRSILWSNRDSAYQYLLIR